MERAGYVDDFRLAQQFIVARAERLGHGRSRLLGDLERRGVSPEESARAWQLLVDSGELTPGEQLRRAVRRRMRGRERLDARAYARVYNALLREGYDTLDIRRELEPYRAADPFHTTGEPDETHDDFP
jgi:SOS response regulatory protein OraA/RecX